jgi:hypothetical protein
LTWYKYTLNFANVNAFCTKREINFWQKRRKRGISEKMGKPAGCIKTTGRLGLLYFVCEKMYFAGRKLRVDQPMFTSS